MNPLANLVDDSVDSPDDELDPRIYASETAPRDKRVAYRYPTLSDQNTAMLRRRGRLCKATLLEESSGGFRVMVPDDFRVQPEERLQVGVHSGWYEVRVAHLQFDDEELILGLERTGIVGTSKPRRTNGEKIVAPNTATRFGWLISTLMILIVGVACVFCVALVMTGGNLSLLVRPAEMANKTDEAAHRFEGTLPTPQAAQLYAGLRQLEDRAVSDQLKLTNAQRQQIEHQLTATSLELTTAHDEHAKEQPKMWEQRVLAVIGQAMDAMVVTLSQEQLAQWHGLLLADAE